jgi:fermentation-respiration switch protein FrsA (DUF1100 family)
VTPRGAFPLPDALGPHPLAVMSHGFSAVRGHGLDRYAEVFAAAGLASLAFDHRGFGASDGQPRQEADPIAQQRDTRHAITFAATLPEVDARRIGLWGTSYSGGHALVVAATDRRVRAVVAQVPTISGWQQALRRTAPAAQAAARAMFDADRAARFAGAAPTLRKVVADAPGEPAVFQDADAAAFFRGAAGWRNAVTLRSIEHARDYEPGVFVPRISPTPLLMIVAEEDTVTPTDLALAAFQAALPPKELLLLPGGHFDPYGRLFPRAAEAAAAFLARHLGAGATSHGRTTPPQAAQT